MTSVREYLRTHPWIDFEHHLERATPSFWSLLGEAVARVDQIAQAVLPPTVAKDLHTIFLIKGARATTAIEGNTLSEEQIKAILEEDLHLPKSQEYLQREVKNVLIAFEKIFEDIVAGNPPILTPQWISEANRRLLSGLEEHLEEGVVPGEIPTFSVGVFRYRGAPRGDCAFLIGKLCKWLEKDKWSLDLNDQHSNRIASAILRAIFVHLYLAWIHAFGDGNGRTARLAELMILACEGVPSPCAHLLSDHYNLTRSEYYRQLDRSSKANSGRGDPMGFLYYSIEGLVDGLRNQNKTVEEMQLRLAWEHYVYSRFKLLPQSLAMRRRREVALALSQSSRPVLKKNITDLTPNIARLYASKTTKTLSRDLNWLTVKDFLGRQKRGYYAKVEKMYAFRPIRA